MAGSNPGNTGGVPGDEPTLETMPLLVGEVVGEYRIDSVLGRGGMGYVYGAVHTVIGKRAAIKVLNRELSLNPEAVERFVTEARAVNQIGHPNIVDVFGFGATDDGRQFMVMEWLRGQTLAERQHEGPLDVPAICRILDAIASALEAAHAEHIAHRDLKPDNVFLSTIKGGGEAVKLLDFGIAKLLGTDEVRMERTRTGFMMGTPAYMSPEQARGKDVDHRTDIYSLGVIAYELFCGTPPFFHETAMDMVVAHMHSTPAAPSESRPGLSEAIDTLVLGMMEKHAGDRPSVADIRASLAEISAGAPRLSALPARGPGRADSAPLPRRDTAPVAPRARTLTTLGTTSGQMAVVAPSRGRAPVVIGAAALVVGLAVVGYLMVGSSQEPGRAAAGSAPPQVAPAEAGGGLTPTPVGAGSSDPGAELAAGSAEVSGSGGGSADPGAGSGDVGAGSGDVGVGAGAVGAGSGGPGPDERLLSAGGADPDRRNIRRPDKRLDKRLDKRPDKRLDQRLDKPTGDGGKPVGSGVDDDGTANPFRK